MPDDLALLSPPTAPLPVLQRARGHGRLTVKHEAGATRLDRLYQDGCGKIRLPRDASAQGLEAVLINTAGGLTGGDIMDWEIAVGDDARLSVSTQACEKVYRARDGHAETHATITVGASARVDWLPQETILFDGGALRRRLDADLAADARLLAVEAVVLGRTAMDETVRQGEIHDRWRIRRDGRLIFADDLLLAGPIAEIAARPPILAGARAFASILLAADDAAGFLAPVRAALDAAIACQGGASAFDGKLFARLAAPDGFALRQALLPVLEALRDNKPLPRVWRI